MKNRAVLVAISTVLALLLLAGCSRNKSFAYGKLDEIHVFADAKDWPEWKDALRSVFSKQFRMPVAESEYILKWHPYEDIEKYKRFKNVFFLSRLDSRLPVSTEVNDLVTGDPTIVKGIKNGDYFHIPQEDTWAHDQYVLFLIAPDHATMIQRIHDLGKLAYTDFKKSYFKRLNEEVFEHKRDCEMVDYIRNNFPFSITVQKDYRLVDEALEDNYVWLRRLNPDRSIAVTWIPYEDSVTIDFDWVVKERNKLGAKIFEGDIVVEEETALEDVKFSYPNSKRLIGTWMNPTHFIGGPFRTIVVNDKQSKMVYFIDSYVQAIGLRKRYYLDQLDVMANTFIPKSQWETE